MTVYGRGVSMAKVTAALGAALVVLAVTAADAQQRRWKWWQDEKSKAEIGLTEEQCSEVELVFQSALPRLKAVKQELDVLESDLSRMIRERVAEESAVAAQVDKVEAARAELSKTRTLMLYRMHRILTPEQHAKVQTIHERREKERDRGRNSRRPESK
jgi:Spy/CpxP family protein refolding chaperone